MVKFPFLFLFLSLSLSLPDSLDHCYCPVFFAKPMVALVMGAPKRWASPVSEAMGQSVGGRYRDRISIGARGERGPSESYHVYIYIYTYISICVVKSQ